MASYRIADILSDEVRNELREYDELVAQLLYNRGVSTKAEAEVFLQPQYETRHDPFLMTDMEKAVERILRALKNGERIAVWSDYDCDGVPGGVLFHDFLTAVQHTNFENYIPHRHNEGFGLNTEGIDALATRGATLIITIDCGIAHVAQVAYAQERGIDVIVTDHHEPGETLPPAYAVLDPKRDTAYPFRELCGTGVAWKLIEALLMRGNFSLGVGTEKWWLDMVGLATLADMVPLRGENRVLAHFGLTVLRKSRRVGLRELFRLLRINPAELTDDDIGFSLGPRVNAASRMGDGMVAFHTFASTDDAHARESAARLEVVNNERKGTVAAMVKEIKKRLKERTLQEVIVIGDPDWRPSLAGLAANVLAEEHARPAFVWGRDGRGTLKGSARSQGVSVIELMRGTADSFIEYGGHHASGGFSVDETRIHTLGDALSQSYKKLSATPTVREPYHVDRELSLEEVNDSLYRKLSALSPFGVGNDKPLFVFRGVIPERVTTFGKGDEHTRVVLARRSGTIEAIAFFKTPTSFTAPLMSQEPADIVGYVERSTFMGRPQIRIRMLDAFPSRT